MIVIAIIGLISAIAAPNLIKTRRDSQATMCTAWLERIAGAKAQAAFADNLASSVTPLDTQILPFIDKPGITSIQGSTDICPAGGLYQVNNLGTNPTCSLAGPPGVHNME
jgi:type II secretory pathway pseudopilin PulG